MMITYYCESSAACYLVRSTLPVTVYSFIYIIIAKNIRLQTNHCVGVTRRGKERVELCKTTERHAFPAGRRRMHTIYDAASRTGGDAGQYEQQYSKI